MVTSRLQKIRTVCGLTMFSLLVGCGQRDSLSPTSAAVTVGQLQEAVQAVNGADYLPFSQAQDGCYARSLYMAMEIAARGIPVSSQFIIASTGNLNPAPGYNWDYHVAPAVWPDSQTEPTILDPSLFSRTVKRSEWIAKLRPTGTYSLKFAPGSETIVSSAALQMGPRKRSDMIRTLTQTGNFRSSDISYSCRIMSLYIDQETQLSPAQRDAKQSKLMQRTKALIRILTRYGIGPERGSISDSATSCY